MQTTRGLHNSRLGPLSIQELFSSSLSPLSNKNDVKQCTTPKVHIRSVKSTKKKKKVHFVAPSIPVLPPRTRTEIPAQILMKFHPSEAN